MGEVFFIHPETRGPTNMIFRSFHSSTAGLAALSFIALASWNLPARGEEWTPQKVEATFRNKCNHCHTVPDPGSSFDRAWLGQVNRTA
tara:strand:+ start:633 stop:896 length:264 start_codon:yes stop_codon:yes gene_type:complete